MRSICVSTALTLSVALAAIVPASVLAGELEVVESFDGTAQELPEGLALDHDGSIYVTMGYPFFYAPGDGWVKNIAPDGTKSTLAHFEGGQGPAGIVIDAGGDVYIARPNPMDPDSRGVWRLTADGASERLPGTEEILVANGLALDGAGHLYASDTALGVIWRVTLDGSEAVESWFADPSILGGCEEGDFGVNGIALTDTGMYAAATSRGVLVHIPMLEDGSAGEAAVVAGDVTSCEPDALFGLDGIALSADGDVYALLVLQHQLVRIDPEDGSVEVLLTADDGLYNPASLTFGTRDADRDSLYLVNYALLEPAPEANLGPAVLKYDVGVEGRPLS